MTPGLATNIASLTQLIVGITELTASLAIFIADEAHM
jgi:hypothetical protein